MKLFTVMALILTSLNVMAAEAKPLVKMSIYNMLMGGGEEIVLKDDGYVYLSSYVFGGKTDESDVVEKAIARVQSEEQLNSIIAAIDEIPVDAKLNKADFESCAIDGGSTISVVGERFEGGSLIISQSACNEVGLVGPKAYLGKAIVNMMNSVYNLEW